MGRAPCCDKANVKKGPWSPEEDSKLKDYIHKYGTGGNWIALPNKAGLRRCGKSCRLRWLNYLRPNIKHGEFSDDEDRVICNLFATIGSRWSIIAAQLPGRTDNDIKNYWNTKLKKKLMNMVSNTSSNSHNYYHHHQLKKPPYQYPQYISSSSSFSPFQTSISFNGYSCNYSTAPTTRFSSSSSMGFEPISKPANFMNTTTTTTSNTSTGTASLVQTQDGLLVGSMQDYYQAAGKDNMFIMFGGEPSCSSSDGSCNQISYGKDIIHPNVHQEQMVLENFFYSDQETAQRNHQQHKFIFGGHHDGLSTERQNGLWVDQNIHELGFGSVVHHHDQDVKQEIVNNNLILASCDENQTQAGKQQEVMYNY